MVSVFAIMCSTALMLFCTSGFNIEVKFPAIRSGGEDSLFGFSVAGHQMQHGDRGLIVGAPFDNNSGSIYWCMYGPSQCRRINFDIHKTAPYSHDALGNELFGFALSTLPTERNRLAVACSPRLSYEVTGKLFVTGGCFAFNNVLADPFFLGASTCLNIPEASRSIDLRFCLDGASTAYFHNSNTDLIVSGSPYYQFAKGMGLVNNITEFNPVRRTDTTDLDDYSLLGSSSVISDRVFSSASDLERPIVSVFGAPGVLQARDQIGSGFVMLSIIEKNTNQIVIPQAQILQGSRFGSRFGHAVAFVDLNGDGWDDLLVGAPFEQLFGPSESSQHDVEGRRVHGVPVLGCVYIFWNQQHRLPSTRAFTFNSMQIIRPPPSLSPKSGFGSAIIGLGDINHDGVNDFAIGAPNDEGGGAVIIYHGSESKEIASPTQILNATELSGTFGGFGFSLTSGGMDLDQNGYPDLAVGAPNSNNIAFFRTRPVIKVDVVAVREDGSSHVEERLDSLEECTRDTQIQPGYWAPRVHCMNMKILATFTPVDPVPCSHSPIPIRLLLTINPREDWLKEEFTNSTGTRREMPVASFFGERVLRLDDPEVRPFYQRHGDALTLSAESDESLPFLVLSGQTATCRGRGAADSPLTRAQLARARTVRLAFRDVNLVDLSSPLRIGIKWLLDAPSPPSAFALLDDYPINNPRENTKQSLITFANECHSQKCNPILLPRFEYSVTRDKDGPVVYVGDDQHQSIELKVTVANRGDHPSYATSVYSVYPEDLLDLSASPQTPGQRATLVKPGLALCHIGNPLPARAKATCLLRFSVLAQQLMKAAKNFTINSTVTASSNHPAKSLAPLTDTITVKVKMSVNVSVTGDVLPDAAYYSGNVTDGILVNNGENKIGATRLLVRVRVQNMRKHSLVPNSRLVIDWPYETADMVTEDNGKFLLYLLEKPYVTKTDLPTTTNTTIVCDSRALEKLVNPYNYRVFKSLIPQPRGDPVATAPVDLPSNHPTKYPPLKAGLDIEKMDNQGNEKRTRTTLSCYNGQLRCTPIVCDLGPLSYRAGVITLEMPARLWDNTMRQDFKDIFMTTVQLTATWRASVTFTVDAGDRDYASDDFELKIFNDMEADPVYPKNMPLYIGLAVFAGLLLLAILIIILWRAKFFERKKFTRKFHRTKPSSDSGPATTGTQPLNISNPPPRQPLLRSPPISAYGDMTN